MLQQLVNGLTIGVIYALIGMGFSMVWATARTMNFAYGAIYAVGAFSLVVVFSDVLGSSTLTVGALGAVLLVAAVVGVAVGYGLELAIFRPLRDSELAPFFASLGVAIVMESILVKIFGGQPTTVEVAAGAAYRLGEAQVTAAQIVVLAGSVFLVAGLQTVVARTSLGRAMRATAFNRQTARLMGIDPDRIIATVFVTSAVLAMWAGVFVGLFYGTVTPYIGSDVLIKGLAAAVVGGFGYLPGAVVGGLMIGLLEAIGAELTTSGNWSDVIAYSVLILVIIVRPQGLVTGKGVVT